MKKRGVMQKSKLVTGVIYGLLLYISILMLKPIAIQLFHEQQCYQFMKHYIFESIPVMEYIHKQEEDEKTFGVLSFLKEMVTTPVQDFLEAHGSSEVAKKTIVLWGRDEQESDTTNKNSIPETMETETTELEHTSTEEQFVVFQELPALQEPVISADGITLPKKQKTIDRTQLNFEFLMSKYYTVVSSTSLTAADLNVETLLNMDMTMKQENNQPQILIYHTHGMEMFKDSTPNDRNTGIVGVGKYLAHLLRERYGYNVIHLESSFDYVNGKLDRSKAYDYAYAEISQVLADHPTIEVVLDIHRDGVGENTHLITDINGKPTAQIMFFNGISRLKDIGEIGYLYNPYRTENLALSLQMKLKAEEYYAGFTRRNYIQAYQYNLHVRPKSMLIEAGAQTNTFEEVKNAMEPLAALLYMELEGY